jgi:spore maturation protein CgeB
MRIAFFGSSLVSAYWNGAATYYRGLIRALAERGHQVTFYEPDAYERQQHRDIEDPSWAKVVVYRNDEAAVSQCLDAARSADVVVKASGVGVFDDLLEKAVLLLRSSSRIVVFWDVDAPATLDRVHGNPADPFHQLIPHYNAILTYGGGDPVVNAYKALGAQNCAPIYNALDLTTHHPTAPQPRFAGDLAFLGNRLPDREKRVEEFFLKPASQRPSLQFVLGGAGWADKQKPENVRCFDHVVTADHNAFNSTPRAVINISRDSMARYGYSPATRVFEAAGAAACIITDEWIGIDRFFEPDREILVAVDGEDVVRHLEKLPVNRARTIGEAAYRRALGEHTYAHRAVLVESILEGRQFRAGGAS